MQIQPAKAARLICDIIHQLCFYLIFTSQIAKKNVTLAKKATDIDMEEYVWGFVRSCFESFEITYWLEGQLACVAVCDLGRNSVSAVYTFFDPELRSASVGTYSILKQIEFCQRRNLKFLYLGYYVAESPHMKYKSRFKPNQRLIDGQWKTFG